MSPAAKILLLLKSQKGRNLLISVLCILLAGLALLMFALPAFVAMTLLTNLFPTDHLDKIQALAASIDAAREEYIAEQVTNGYFLQTAPDGETFRNTVLQWQNGVSNNDKEIISTAACYYQQEWDTRDFSSLCCLMALRSIAFSSSTSGPYRCAGCQTRTVCGGHIDDDGATYYHSDTSECSNPTTETSCPGNHYDLYVTASLLGWELQSEDGAAISVYVEHWPELTDTSFSSSDVINQYAGLFAQDGGNPDWTTWNDYDITWAKNLFSTDWQDLYGVSIIQMGIVAGDAATPYILTEQDKAFSGSASLMIPIAFYSYISTWYGEPDAIYGRAHRGMDFAAAGGTPILAAADGIVVQATYHASWGNYVKLYNGTVDGQEIYTLYAHASTLWVTPGQLVSKGQQIAAVGSTGDSTGNHLHFELYVGSSSRLTDPAPWIGIAH